MGPWGREVLGGVGGPSRGRGPQRSRDSRELQGRPGAQGPVSTDVRNKGKKRKRGISSLLVPLDEPLEAAERPSSGTRPPPRPAAVDARLRASGNLGLTSPNPQNQWVSLKVPKFPRRLPLSPPQDTPSTGHPPGSWKPSEVPGGGGGPTGKPLPTWETATRHPPDPRVAPPAQSPVPGLSEPKMSEEFFPGHLL